MGGRLESWEKKRKKKIIKKKKVLLFARPFLTICKGKPGRAPSVSMILCPGPGWAAPE
jgi:hypothetical protein